MGPHGHRPDVEMAFLNSRQEAFWSEASEKVRRQGDPVLSQGWVPPAAKPGPDPIKLRDTNGRIYSPMAGI